MCPASCFATAVVVVVVAKQLQLQLQLQLQGSRAQELIIFFCAELFDKRFAKTRFLKEFRKVTMIAFKPNTKRF